MISLYLTVFWHFSVGSDSAKNYQVGTLEQCHIRFPIEALAKDFDSAVLISNVNQ